MGASIADILSNKEKSQLVLPNINKGDVFKMRLTPKEGIIPKNKGDNDRDKYFIIVGKQQIMLLSVLLLLIAISIPIFRKNYRICTIQ